MSAEIEAWNERAAALNASQDFNGRLRLVEEVAESDAAPEHLKTVARRAATTLRRFIKGGLRSEHDRHSATSHFVSFVREIPVNQDPPVSSPRRNRSE